MKYTSQTKNVVRIIDIYTLIITESSANFSLLAFRDISQAFHILILILNLCDGNVDGEGDAHHVFSLRRVLHVEALIKKIYFLLFSLTRKTWSLDF